MMLIKLSLDTSVFHKALVTSLFWAGNYGHFKNCINYFHTVHSNSLLFISQFV